MHSISFQPVFQNHPSNNAFIILYDNQSAGKLVFNTDNNSDNQIIQLDIEGYFFNELKDKLLECILFSFAQNNLTMITLKTYQEYYTAIGFIFDKMINKNYIKMIYPKQDIKRI